MSRLSEEGVTFLELLLVLMMMGVLTAVVLPVSSGWSSAQTEKDALEAFKATVQHMQSYSMANRTTTSLAFSDGGRTYTVSYSDKPEKRTASFPPSIALDQSSRFRSFIFQTNGNMYETGTLFLKTETGLKKIKFQFQRGRMIIDE